MPIEIYDTHFLHAWHRDFHMWVCRGLYEGDITTLVKAFPGYEEPWMNWENRTRYAFLVRKTPPADICIAKGVDEDGAYARITAQSFGAEEGEKIVCVAREVIGTLDAPEPEDVMNHEADSYLATMSAQYRKIAAHNKTSLETVFGINTLATFLHRKGKGMGASFKEAAQAYDLPNFYKA